MTRLVAGIVQQGIRAFERGHPGWTVSGPARKVVRDHAAQNERHILDELAKENVRKTDMVHGLRDVLEQSLLEQARKREGRGAVWIGDVQASWRWERPRFKATIERIDRKVAAQSVRVALKKKCKTFPWC